MGGECHGILFLAYGISLMLRFSMDVSKCANISNAHELHELQKRDIRPYSPKTCMSHHTSVTQLTATLMFCFPNITGSWS